MGLIECASNVSYWRGYDYFKKNKVENLIETGEGLFTAEVQGSSDEPYIVEIDIKHPRRSKCNCPHADGKRIICKHMVAVYLTVYPEEAERIYNEAIAYEEEEERRSEELMRKVVAHIKKMKKEELQQTLTAFLLDGPEWQYDRFVRMFDLEEY